MIEASSLSYGAMVSCNNCGSSVPRRGHYERILICNVCEDANASKTAFIKHCIKCGLRIEKCPCESIQEFYVVPTHKYGQGSFQSLASGNIVNYPQSTKRGMKESKDICMHQMAKYSPNEPESFQLLRLPVPRLGKVLGIVGPNEIGKTTSLQILSGRLKPNLGCLKNPPEWDEVLTHFHGSELKNYFTRVQNKDLKVLEKEQQMRGHNNPSWHKFWARWVLWDQLDNNQAARAEGEQMFEKLDLVNMDRSIEDLSADELARFMIALAAVQKADIYIFDQPSRFLDVRQRHKAAQVIRSLIRPNRYIYVVDHDLSFIDCVADEVCIMYGKPGSYGVATSPLLSLRD